MKRTNDDEYGTTDSLITLRWVEGDETEYPQHCNCYTNGGDCEHTITDADR